ncbi:MAG TPA: hypothetical protein PLJ37_00785 [Chitinophagales bacterium]|nr:hypothetical protein [Chitinophagales bacterium]HMW93487.1 hypothetical protein [Chitinophagales bacterium]HMZ92890.1 hypothetical protein [Chitinophagales bacterium]HNG25921.1 hypothetical protein [Chitinophagales bacterium]
MDKAILADTKLAILKLLLEKKDPLNNDLEINRLIEQAQKITAFVMGQCHELPGNTHNRAEANNA